MPPYPLTNFEKQSYYQKEAKPNDIYSRKSSPKIMNGTHIINIDEQKTIGTYWMVLYVNGDSNWKNN